ncbi:uncharacterized protein LOC123558802 [Mercenaria mercenaria]|uniref:uncharacterized protein LOC123558802 n=1 Tax=Mercenaria mercenaria TaxID=6596 RepID=UPI001E1D661A|nr:uncharacterized protein LOC123558802 [Mercenaria mercenaria]
MAESGSKPEIQTGKETDTLTQDIEEQGSSQLKARKDRKVSVECFKHDGKPIDVYCNDHDTVCCSMCIESGHRSCKNIKAIHDVAKRELVTEKLPALRINIQGDQKELLAKKSTKQAVLVSLYQTKDVIQREIRGFRMRINDRLEKIEKDSTGEADDIFKWRLQQVLSEIKDIDNTLTHLDRSHEQITQAKVESGVIDAFIHLKIANECRNEIDALEKKMGNYCEEFSLKFYPNQKMERCLEKLGHIGQFREISTAIWHADVNVKVPDDAFPCEVSGFSQTNDGSIYITDYVNMRLKKMQISGESYSITNTLDLPSFPWGICQIDERRLMVTLKQASTVLIISLDEPLSVESHFDAGDKIRGIAYFDGSVYVCCGGSKIYNEGVGRLEVYGINGKILRAYFEHFSCPSDIKISETGTEIYVSDAYNGMIVVDNDGHLLYKIDLPELDVLCGVCKIGSDKSCIAGFKSNNIVLVNEQNLRYNEILGITDGIELPKGLHYDEKKSILFVSMGRSDLIKLFKLE